MTEVPHILSPLATIWTSWVMLMVLICGALAEIFQSGVIVQSFSSLFSTNERTYHDAPKNWISQLLLYLFRMAIVGMAFYLSVHKEGMFLFSGYMWAMALVLGWTIVRGIVSVLVDYTFGISKRFAPVFVHYDNIWTVVCCCLYPILLVLLNIDKPKITWIVLGSVGILLFVLMMVKWIRVFFTGIRSLLYIILYVFTVEILPIFGILVVLDSLV